MTKKAVGVTLAALLTSPSAVLRLVVSLIHAHHWHHA
jgi:hypothetical protein